MAKVFRALGLNSRFFCFSLSFGLPAHCEENINKKFVQVGSFSNLTSRKYNLCYVLKTNYCLNPSISIPMNKWNLSLKWSVHLLKLLAWLGKLLLSQALRWGIWFLVSFLSMALFMFPFNDLISPRKCMLNWAFLELWPLNQSGRWSTLESYQTCPRIDITWPS